MDWEGAFARVDDELSARHVSPEFCTFEAQADVDPRFIGYALATPAIVELVAGSSGGTNLRRRRLYADDFLSKMIPMPDETEQRRIADHLDRVSDITSRAADVVDNLDQHPAVELLPSLVDQVLLSLASDHVSAGTLYDVVADTVHPGDPYDGADCFVGLQHVESHTGRQLGSLPLGDETGRKFRFRAGDVVYGYLRPYLNKVWVADRAGLCSVDQYVLRAKDDIDPYLLAYCLRSRSTLVQAEELTHNLQLPRLRTKLLQGITVADPRTLKDDARLKLDQLTAKLERLALEQSRRRRLASAVLPSALNRAFAGLA